jgi:nucleotide-binding universal stress UspA family protein
MTKILLATDGSEDAVAAGRLLEQWPLAGRARVIVLTVVAPVAPLSPGLLVPTADGWSEVRIALEGEVEKAQQIAEAAATRLREQGVEVESAVRHGPPVQEILETLALLTPELVVLGSHGQSQLEQMLIGSVSQNVAQHAFCSALVVRNGGSWRGRLLLAVDGSPEGERAIQSLMSLPLPEETECTVLHVLEPMPNLDDPSIPHRMAAAEHLVEKTAATLATAGYKVIPQVQQGHDAQEILQVIKSLHPDLVVVGARGVTGIQEFHLGSVSGRVLRYAPCSVLIAR